MTTEFGYWAEDQAGKYLQGKGYLILDKNYRKKWGEIDIIAKKKDIIIFVEVKANKKDVSGFEPELRVGPEKIRRLNRAIQTYLAANKYPPEQERQIDIIALTLDRERGVAKIKHFKNIEI